MDIARAAHREALRDMQPPPTRTSVPGLPSSPTPARAPRDIVFGQLFAVISRCVRQTMLLEDRLAAGITYHPREIPLHTLQPPAPEAATQAPPRQSCADRLRPERLEQEDLEELEDNDQPAEEILAKVRATFEAAIAPGPTQQALTPELAKFRRPIPVIPLGPEAPPTAFERSVLAYNQLNARPRKPDS